MGALLPIIAGVMIASMAEPEFSMFAFAYASPTAHTLSLTHTHVREREIKREGERERERKGENLKRFKDFHLKTSPEYGRDCLICATFDGA